MIVVKGWAIARSRRILRSGKRRRGDGETCGEKGSWRRCWRLFPPAGGDEVGALTAVKALRPESPRFDSQDTETSFRPITPPTMDAMQSTRTSEAESPST